MGIGTTIQEWKVKDKQTGEDRYMLSKNVIGHGSATSSQFRVDLDNNIIITHNAPNCTSGQNFRSILKGKSKGVFNGKTIVKQKAQKTNSSQSNKNLLISKDALMYSNPQLEIYADDVKCSHGSTSGNLDEDSIFYLMSRGLSHQQSKELLINGFLMDAVEKITDLEIKNLIKDMMGVVE